eukprot:s4432_g2.t1
MTRRVRVDAAVERLLRRAESDELSELGAGASAGALQSAALRAQGLLRSGEALEAPPLLANCMRASRMSRLHPSLWQKRLASAARPSWQRRLGRFEVSQKP